ncbi:coiled-coil domain-containing protein 112 isoform X2 [Nothobranchius furzeri]|uniref:Transcript variant X2 n=1 Tax=Nothobranchius furzeri TaxID=105023 RepID=A0A9D2XFW8_NOTFU|nr:coiled-coil domain-containing protein 112 isoform X2 [Nothobranchius furzeri]KAF7200449.1 transcript variant X2 [Nothobranchius furzeri]
MAALASTRKNISTDDGGSSVPGTTTSRTVRADSKGVPGEKRETQSKILLKQISSGMKTFEAQRTHAKPTLELIEKLDRILSEMENSITNLREELQSCLEDCVKEQRKHTDSSSISENQNISKLASEAGPSRRNLPAEVIALEVFLQNSGGPCGGWDQSDHRVFMKIWMKHRGKSSYREEVLQYLPGKRLKEVKQHEEWHQDLLSLKDQKKEAIQRWKANKAEEQRQKLKAAQRREEVAEQRRIRNNNVWYQRLKDFREMLAREEEKIKQKKDTMTQLA